MLKLTKREAETSFDDFINRTLKSFFNPNNSNEAKELLNKVYQLGICSDDDMNHLKNIYESLTGTEIEFSQKTTKPKTTKIEIKDGSTNPPITNINTDINNKKEEVKSRLQSIKIGNKAYNNFGGSFDKIHLHGKDGLRKEYPSPWATKKELSPQITDIIPEPLPSLDSLTKNELDKRLEGLNLITEMLDKALNMYNKLQDSAPATKENRILYRMFLESISSCKFIVALNRIKTDPKLQ